MTPGSAVGLATDCATGPGPCLAMIFGILKGVKKVIVKPAVAATSIKRNPPLSGHFRVPRMISNANEPLLSVHQNDAKTEQV